MAKGLSDLLARILGPTRRLLLSSLFSLTSFFGFTRFLGFTHVEVEGNSMAPTFRTGQRILIKLFKEVPSQERVLKLHGRVILVEREEYPGIFLLKRLEKVHGDLMWVEGDNKDPAIAELQHDSRKFGWLSRECVRGVAL